MIGKLMIRHTMTTVKIHLAFLILSFCSIQMIAQEIQLMTYNIRYSTKNDGENQWERRKDFVCDQLAFYEPDIFGIQEGLHAQVMYLDQKMTDFEYVGIGRDDGNTKGEYSAIFYNRQRFQLLGHDTFWLSDRPNEISVGWDASMERICTYAFFMDKLSGKSFWVFNTHFDHRGVKAREKSGELILQRIKELNKDDLPVILMGDFNLNEASGPIVKLSKQMNDSRRASENAPFGPYGTFTGFEYHQPVKDRIDYIFTSKENVRVLKYAVIADFKELRFPSDHFPVMVNIELDSN